MTRKQKRLLRRILASAAAIAALQFIPVGGLWRLGLYLAVYAVIGYDVLRKSALGVVRGRVFDESFLMSIATLGAFALAIWEKSGDYNEAVAVLLFYQIGELFQSCAVDKSRKSIRALMDIRPDYANVACGGELRRVDPAEVEPGSVIVVQPGEKLPLDGVVVAGRASLDVSALTGESVPRGVAEGDEVASGCVDLSGVLKIRTTKPFGESTVSRILELVENASARKARSEAFIARFARVYTPAVCALALALGLVGPLVRLAAGLSGQWSLWLYRALSFLVVSCPCALVVSVPLSFFAAIGGAGREGILIKGANYLERLAQVRCVVFDKTGTLTQGVFAVQGVHHAAMEDARLLEYAALAECASAHPISKSLQSAFGRAIDRRSVSNVEELAGCGVTAEVDGTAVAVGNDKLMARVGIEPIPCRSVGTVVHVAVGGRYAGHLVIADRVKPGAAEAVAALRRVGVERTVMLTGDRRAAAEAVAAQLRVDEVFSELLPEDKVARVEALLAGQARGESLAFVGDGVNDAPVLMRADVGIAMGALGSDAAIEAADVVLMDDDPRQIARAVRIARKCRRIVRENVVFSLGVKLGCLALTAAGAADMWAAIFADVGVMVLAVLNAVRAMRVPRR